MTHIQPASFDQSRAAKVSRALERHARSTDNIIPLSRPVPAVLDRPPYTDNMCDAWDITDAWHEAGGDEDQECKGYFDLNNDGEQYNPTLVAIEVIERGHSQYLSLDAAMAQMRLPIIHRIEQAYGMEINE